MGCLSPPAPAPRPRLRLITSFSRLAHCRGRLLQLQRWSTKPRHGLCMAEMISLRSSRAWTSPELELEAVVVTGRDGDAIRVVGEKLQEPRREAVGWALVEAELNRMSKWLVSGSLAAAALWKQDAGTMWALVGAVVNTLLASALKRKLNHERPEPALRTDPGMPSSHAQSIFYAATMLVLSWLYLANACLHRNAVSDWLGSNSVAMILGAATLSIASYLSWLRVSQRLHTLNQVLVGAVLGSGCGALWLELWRLLVRDAFDSSLLVQIVVILGSAAFWIGFAIYILLHWLKNAWET